jgi:hypothetical protein
MMDDRELFRNFRLMITQPGEKTGPLGLIEADTAAEAWLWAKQLVRDKCEEESIDPDSRVDLIDPKGKWIEPSSTVAELLNDRPAFFAEVS